MKIAIINDTHFGARNDSSLFLEYFLDFFENQFFPYLTENNIHEVLHLGDLMDRRKYVNFSTLSEVKRRFFDVFDSNKLNLHMILGNHDTFYRNTNEINSPSELFRGYDFFHLYEEPTTLQFDGLSLSMIPWICKQNTDQIVQFLNQCKSPIICGHFELNGYEVMRGIKFTHGMDDNILSRFEKVLSGHFHNKSTQKNVYYLGTQYQITFSDLEDMKGFHVLDTETRELEFVENKNKMFYSLNPQSIIDDYSVLKNKYVKFCYSTDDDRKHVDNMLTKIENESPYDFTIVESHNLNSEDDSALDLSKDTMTIINEEIDNLELDLNKNELKKIAHEVYMEALSQ